MTPCNRGADGKQPQCGKSHRQCEIDWLKARIQKTFGMPQAGPKALCTDYLCAVLTGTKDAPGADRARRARAKKASAKRAMASSSSSESESSSSSSESESSSSSSESESGSESESESEDMEVTGDESS